MISTAKSFVRYTRWKSKQRIGDVLELEIQGRLDGYWADHLAQSLDDAIREGTRNLRLNLSGVSYSSSAGIRVLVRAHKQLSAIQGSFRFQRRQKPCDRFSS